MKKIVKYLKDSYNELVYKVTWPTRKEFTSSAVIVMTASIIMALVVFGIDSIFQHIVDFLYDVKGSVNS